MNSGTTHHVVNEGDVIDNASKWCDDVAEEFSAAAAGLKPEGGLHPWSQSILKGFDMFAEAGWLSVMFFELWFVIPEIEVAGGTTHEQLNDAFSAGGVVQLLKFCAAAWGGVSLRGGFCQQDSSSESPESLSGLQAATA
jgi:hypothetical protein